MRSHRREGVVRRGLAALAALAAGVVVAALPAATAPSRAAIPAPEPGMAMLQVSVADYRDSDTTLAPLAGVTLGLFLVEPSARIDAVNGFATPDATHQLFFVCVSDLDGDCVFQVPIRSGVATVGATQTAPYMNLAPGQGQGVPEGTRLYLASLAAPNGYYANPFWQTGPLSPSGGDPLIELRHVWQSPRLVANTSYLSGDDWISSPGLQTAPQNTAPNYTRRIASSGVVAFSRFNLDMIDQCGLDVAFIVDVSSSVATTSAGNPDPVGRLKGAMDAFVDALRGTPSRVALYTFGTDSPAYGTMFGANSPLVSVATTGEATAFKNRYAGWTTAGWPTNYTNWDRGFAAAADANGPPGSPTHVDLAVFLTDGNPTVYGRSPLVNPNNPNSALKDTTSGYTRFRELSAGLGSANLLKEQGTRILAVGVGAGVAGTGAAANLRTVSGRDAFGGANFLEADYLQTSDYVAAGNALRDVVLASCAPSLSVIKRIVPATGPQFDGDGNITNAYLPGDAWTFEGSSIGATPVAIANPVEQTDLGTGALSFDLSFGSEATDLVGQIRVEEQNATAPHSTFTPLPAQTRCVERSTGADVPITATPDAGEPNTAFSVSIGAQQIVSCTVYNQEPPRSVPASVVVHKMWELHSAVGVSSLPDGAQPSGMSAALEITGPDADTLTPQQWSVERTGYNLVTPAAESPANSVRIDEQATIEGMPGCTITDRNIRPGPAGPPGTDPVDPGVVHPLVAGVNEWTITNVVSCASTLTLIKDVTNGVLDTPAGENLWTLNAIATPSVGVLPLEQFSGLTGVTSEVVPDAPYSLREDRPAAAAPDSPEHETYHYQQHDIRSIPLVYPSSSGSWDCGPAGTTSRDFSLSAEGAIIVPLGMHYECTARNTTAFMTVAKIVDDGSADPDDFRFGAAWIPPLLVPEAQATVHIFAPGEEQSLVPGQHYRLFETDAPGYLLTSLSCEAGGVAVDPSDFVLLPGAEVACVAHNGRAAIAATGVSTPAWLLPAGLLLLLLGAAGLAIGRRRQRRFE
ncbi:VWA domain-containing protein [Protaetiibacter larvae]|uniref:VWA domain-containing protein n=1 Tax=Protaetiibacter larvae TaxID=2592654 RepID=A0A5C1Y9Z3_9MICO|nr:VWA domain-containing protein [Protaetiibacter larvae]QEO10460.1 VWA domain-containing protein [Protaetiibacter larvae]